MTIHDQSTHRGAQRAKPNELGGADWTREWVAAAIIVAVTTVLAVAILGADRSPNLSGQFLAPANQPMMVVAPLPR